MRVYRNLDSVPAGFAPCALTIGNFDGLHAGHRLILRRMGTLARERGWKPSALTFSPHPTRIVAPERTPLLLTSVEERVELMRGEGIEQVVILPFVPEVAALTPEQFGRTIVSARLGARAIFVGENFHFGHGQAGNVRVLEGLGRELGFLTEIVPAARCRGRVVSSSSIRELIRSGNVSLARRLLERPHALAGAVVGGRGVGSKETVPTLNLETHAEVIPANGVYITRTWDLDLPRHWTSVTNIGYRPTFGDSPGRTIETFLLDPLRDETPARIRVQFLKRIRPEIKFEDSGALKSRILHDVRIAQRYFRRECAWSGRAGGAQ